MTAGVILAAVAGLAEGLAAGAALAALLVLLAVGVRVAAVTGTLPHVRAYQWALAAGAFAAGIQEAWPFTLRGGVPLAAALGLGMGLFVGMLAAALAETASALPAASRHLGLVPYLPRLVVAVSLGKALGAVLWLAVPSLFSRPPM